MAQKVVIQLTVEIDEDDFISGEVSQMLGDLKSFGNIKLDKVSLEQ